MEPSAKDAQSHALPARSLLAPWLHQVAPEDSRGVRLGTDRVKVAAQGPQQGTRGEVNIQPLEREIDYLSGKE